MATPIKETPVLTGKDARNFDAWMKQNQDKKVSPDSYQRIKAAAKKFKVV
ncbi:hypothetical protein NP603_05295 [Methylomonas sp. SURF-1]|uniref:Uncharacterized protein n=1 Tax=Methylomonas aurea TaxID=2952224 RepID=A0ABT1UE48_9GAMM|nr:hypothetical protein [Methylomonas sp. SURF-1]MCQ8180511.1 hypothetical protein [Methylomonas sp. SURF-1]